MKNKIKNFIKEHTKETIIFSIIVIAILIYFIVPSFASLIPVKSVVITSEHSSYENNDPGAWQVTKSGEWTGKGEATVTFDVDTVLKSETQYTDIIFVLDISNSMNGDKIAKVKTDSVELIETLLSNSNNRAALITFDTTSAVVSGLTNDKEELTNQINGLSVGAATNYYQALVNVDTILQDYTKEDNREMIVLFLTDGYPNVDIPNQIAQYEYLKNQYPYITINGIQYEMGNEILEPIIQVSDNQYFADMETLNNVLFDASVNPEKYVTYQIIDYVENTYFSLNSVDDITVSQGTVELTEEEGKQKIIWTITDLKTGGNANLSMKLQLKEEFIGQGGIYPTNESEEIISTIEDIPDENVSSTLTPVLEDNYEVIYDGNDPEGCTVSNMPETVNYSVYDTVAVSQEKPTCSGYEFKGWEFESDNINKVNDDYFIMPENDVTLRATWSKVELAKSMDGTVYSITDFYYVIANQAVMDNISSEFVSSNTGINFSQISSDTNGKGVYEKVETENDEYPVYYYRGDVDNNHVKFAGFCWRAVRTTSTGGVKLIYDGEPDENGNCDNTGTASQLETTSAFNSIRTSPADVGYMYGERYTYSRKNMSSGSEGIIYGNNAEWDGSKYILIDTYTSSNGWSEDRTTLATKYHYTCLSADNTCNSVYYINYFQSSSTVYYLTLSNGADIESAKNEMFTNTTNSTIKTVIDNWYSENIAEYTDYLEDTVWCNDRSIYSGSLGGKDFNAGTLPSYFGAYVRWMNGNPSVECPSDNDSFTVSAKNGNGALTYPIALLTEDEMMLAGGRRSFNNTNYYLYTGQHYWSLSPYSFSSGAYNFILTSSGRLEDNFVNISYGVRPAISLVPGIDVVNGDGSSESPYEVAMQ